MIPATLTPRDGLPSTYTPGAASPVEMSVDLAAGGGLAARTVVEHLAPHPPASALLALSQGVDPLVGLRGARVEMGPHIGIVREAAPQTGADVLIRSETWPEPPPLLRSVSGDGSSLVPVAYGEVPDVEVQVEGGEPEPIAGPWPARTGGGDWLCYATAFEGLTISGPPGWTFPGDLYSRLQQAADERILYVRCTDGAGEGGWYRVEALTTAPTVTSLPGSLSSQGVALTIRYGSGWVPTVSGGLNEWDWCQLYTMDPRVVVGGSISGLRVGGLTYPTALLRRQPDGTYRPRAWTEDGRTLRYERIPMRWPIDSYTEATSALWPLTGSVDDALDPEVSTGATWTRAAGAGTAPVGFGACVLDALPDGIAGEVRVALGWQGVVELAGPGDLIALSVEASYEAAANTVTSYPVIADTTITGTPADAAYLRVQAESATPYRDVGAWPAEWIEPDGRILTSPTFSEHQEIYAEKCGAVVVPRTIERVTLLQIQGPTVELTSPVVDSYARLRNFAAFLVPGKASLSSASVTVSGAEYDDVWSGVSPAPSGRIEHPVDVLLDIWCRGYGLRVADAVDLSSRSESIAMIDARLGRPARLALYISSQTTVDDVVDRIARAWGLAVVQVGDRLRVVPWLDRIGVVDIAEADGSVILDDTWPVGWSPIDATARGHLIQAVHEGGVIRILRPDQTWDGTAEDWETWVAGAGSLVAAQDLHLQVEQGARESAGPVAMRLDLLGVPDTETAVDMLRLGSVSLLRWLSSSRVAARFGLPLSYTGTIYPGARMQATHPRWSPVEPLRGTIARLLYDLAEERIEVELWLDPPAASLTGLHIDTIDATLERWVDTVDSSLDRTVDSIGG